MGALRGLGPGVLAAWLAGCGGISQSGAVAEGAAGESVGGAVAGSGQGPSPPGSGGSPSTRCALPSTLLWLEPEWEEPVSSTLTRRLNFFAFSPDGTRIAVPAEEFLERSQTEYSVLDGSVVAAAGPPALARDGTWRRELRIAYGYYPRYSFSVLDRATERAVWGIARNDPPVAALSSDGERVVSLTCSPELGVEQHDVLTASSKLVALDADAAACDAYIAGPLRTTRTGTAALLARAPSGRVTVIDFEHGSASEHAVYGAFAAAPHAYPPPNTLLALELSPSETLLAVTAVGQPLRVLGYPGFERRLPDLPTAMSEGAENCYCRPRYFSPVAWSPDERLLASLDGSGQAVIRRTCDGVTVAVLAAELPPGMKVAMLAFSPDGSGLAALAFSTAGDRLSYYRLAATARGIGR